MMEEVKALKVFKGIFDFGDFYDKYSVFKYWKIRGEKLKERAEVIKEKNYFIDFKNEFSKKKLHDNEVSDEEIVTWIDTFYILNKIFLYMINDLDCKEPFYELSIIMEYRIPFGNYKRIDYILCYRNNAIIIEFGMDNSNDKENTKRYNKKLTEAIEYKEILSNILSDKRILAIPFIYNSEDTEEDIAKNINKIQTFAQYLKFVFYNDKNAFEELIDKNSLIKITN